MLRVLLNRYDVGNTGALLNCLSKEKASAVSSLQILSHSPENSLISPKEQIQKIHYSWLISTLKKWPKEILPYVLSSLSPGQLKGVGQLLSTETEPTIHPVAPSKLMESYLLWHLIDELGGRGKLPADFIPQTPLSSLLKLDKSQLLEIIDYLGLHDLSQEIRQIVDKQQLKKIFEVFNKKYQLYLRSILHQPDKIVSQKFNLKELILKPEELKKLIHRRGMLRFAKALQFEKPDFIWHISHILDTGRSSLIEKYREEKENLKIVEFLYSQIHQIIQFITEKKNDT